MPRPFSYIQPRLYCASTRPRQPLFDTTLRLSYRFGNHRATGIQIPYFILYMGKKHNRYANNQTNYYYKKEPSAFLFKRLHRLSAYGHFSAADEISFPHSGHDMIAIICIPPLIDSLINRIENVMNFVNRSQNKIINFLRCFTASLHSFSPITKQTSQSKAHHFLL